jgi:hypothetical protein
MTVTRSVAAASPDSPRFDTWADHSAAGDRVLPSRARPGRTLAVRTARRRTPVAAAPSLRYSGRMASFAKVIEHGKPGVRGDGSRQLPVWQYSVRDRWALGTCRELPLLDVPQGDWSRVPHEGEGGDVGVSVGPGRGPRLQVWVVAGGDANVLPNLRGDATNVLPRSPRRARAASRNARRRPSGEAIGSRVGRFESPMVGDHGRATAIQPGHPAQRWGSTHKTVTAPSTSPQHPRRACGALAEPACHS